MRIGAAGLALVLAVGTMPLAATPAGAAGTLASRLGALVGEFPGSAAIWVADPGLAQPLYSHRPDDKIVTASLYKLALLLEVEHQVELGRLRYGDTIVIEDADITEDGSFEAPGTELTVDEALERMITISDNGTAMHLWRMLGPAAINAYLVKSGIRDLRVALDESEDNVGTARAVGTFFTLLAKRQLVSPAASDRMLRRLERQQINDRIPAQLPEGTTVAHKTGNLAGIVHDAGIVSTRTGQRVVVVMTSDSDGEVAADLISHVASAVYASAVAAPAAVAYRVPQEPQYVELGTTLALDVTLDNSGEEPWTTTGPGSFALVWEMRDAAGGVLMRSPRGLPLGPVAPGASVSVPLVLRVPTRPADAKLILGLVDAGGRALAAFGVATATVPLRVHLPLVVDATVEIPALMHRREATLIQVGYKAREPVRADDHHMSLGWRFIDPATGRVVAQGQQPLGPIKTYERVGTFFAPLVAPNVRGTYTLEYEIRERGFIAGMARQQTVEILAPRTFGDEVGPPSTRPASGTSPRPTPTRTPLPTAAPTPTLAPGASARPTTAPRPSALP